MILLNTGMGADIVYFPEKTHVKDERWQFRFIFQDGSGFTIRFWWFGYVHVAKRGEELGLARNPGPSPFEDECNPRFLEKMLEKKKNMGIKNFLVNQKIISGIGNVRS